MPRLASPGYIGSASQFARLNHIVASISSRVNTMSFVCVPGLTVPLTRPMRGRVPTCLWCMARWTRN